jgi:FMN-dependent NADH-azoreductase
MRRTVKLLHIDSSILGGHSASRQISHDVVERLRGQGGTVEVVRRDIVADPLPHLELSNLPSRHPLAAQLDPAAREASAAIRAESDQVLQEFLDADVVVIGAPMYNFTVPSQLKAWIDRILVAGVTFSYGPDGLAGGKRVILVPARGGFYGQGSPAAAFEHLETYLRTVFGFIGVSDLETVIVEGLAAGPEARASALERAAAAARELKAA